MPSKFITVFLFSLFTLNSVRANDADHKIVTGDVINFWEAVDSLQNNKDTIGVFQSLVIDRASDEFKIFIKKWNIKAGDYAKQLRRFPLFYKTLRENTFKLISYTDSIQKTINKFKAVYPGFVPATICIGFGNFSTGGNIEVNNNGQYVYIGLEFHGLAETTEVNEFPVSLQDYLSRSNLFRTIIHELVHIQQSTHGKKVENSFYGDKLVYRVLREGIPDFIAKLICPDGNNGNHFNYGIKHEEELKLKFKAAMYSTDEGDWFGRGKFYDTFPRDLGYYVGSAIARNFYSVNNLAGNLTPIIEIKNAEAFIRQSKFFEE